MKRLALLLPLLALAAGCANVSFSQPGGEIRTDSSATVSDWTLTVLNGNTGEPPSLRLVRGGEPVDWRPPERLAAWVAETDGKFVVSPFRGILGFDGFRVDALSGTTGSRLTCYLSVIGDDLVPVAESFGDPGDEDHAVDLDGDGVDELVCDVTWEMGGHPRFFPNRPLLSRGRDTCANATTRKRRPSGFGIFPKDRCKNPTGASGKKCMKKLPVRFSLNDSPGTPPRTRPPATRTPLRARRSPPRESSCPRAAKPRHPAAAVADRFFKNGTNWTKMELFCQKSKHT